MFFVSTAGHVGDVVADEVVLLQFVGKGRGVGVAREGDMAVAGEDLQYFRVEFLAGAFAPFRIGRLPQEGGLVAECDVFFKGIEPAVGVVFGRFLFGF